MRVHTSGARDAVKLAYALHTAADTGLERELNKGSRQAVREIIDEVKEDPAAYIPQGFEDEFIGSLQARASVRLLQQRVIEAVFWAMGQHGHRRKIEDMDAGVLRHPVRGRTRRIKRHWVHKATVMLNPWVDQPIRPGVISEPGQRALPRAVDRLDAAVGRVVQQIERG